jgi:hypothetical protein
MSRKATARKRAVKTKKAEARVTPPKKKQQVKRAAWREDPDWTR